MTPFEEELRKALARSEPGDDFTHRVLCQTATAKATAGPEHWFATNRLLRFVPVAALLVVLISAVFVYREHERRGRGEAAKEQLLTAMHIAGAQLHEAQMRVKKIENPEAVMQ